MTSVPRLPDEPAKEVAQTEHLSVVRRLAHAEPGAPTERIALIGFGAIGARVFEQLRGSIDPNVTVIAVLLPTGSATRSHPALLAEPSLLTDRIEALLERRPSLVIECAGHDALDRYGEQVLAAGCDLVVTSIGALALVEREKRLSGAADRGRARVVLPAGAIAGIDWLSAARASGLTEVIYRSRKPPLAWRGTPAERCLDLDRLTRAQVFHRCNAREAALAYPKNANVAATVALAGLGFDATQVELIADPEAPGNVHEIEARGSAGELSVRVVGRPDPQNPKTSMLTAYSVARAALNRSAGRVI